MVYKDDITKGYKLLAFKTKPLKLAFFYLFGEVLNSSSFFQMLPEGIKLILGVVAWHSKEHFDVIKYEGLARFYKNFVWKQTVRLVQAYFPT